MNAARLGALLASGHPIPVMAGAQGLTPEQASILATAMAGTGSKAGVRFVVDPKTKQVMQEEIDKDGKPVLDPQTGLPKLTPLTGPGVTPSVPRGGTTTDANGNPTQTPFNVAAGGSVYDPKTGTFTQAPTTKDVPPARTTVPGGDTVIGPDGKPVYTAPPTSSPAAITSSQAQLIDAYVNELSKRTDLDEAAKKAAFDTWWKINVELPNTNLTTAGNVQKNIVEPAQQRALLQAQWQNASQGNMQSALQAAMANRGLAGQNMTTPTMPDMDAVASAAVVKALHNISPTATAINNASGAVGGGQVAPSGAAAPATPLPAQLPGSTVPPTSLPIANQVAALAANKPLGANAAAGTVDMNSLSPEELQRLITLGAGGAP